MNEIASLLNPTVPIVPIVKRVNASSQRVNTKEPMATHRPPFSLSYKNRQKRPTVVKR
jgi:hypothetical protein